MDTPIQSLSSHRQRSMRWMARRITFEVSDPQLPRSRRRVLISFFSPGLYYVLCGHSCNTIYPQRRDVCPGGKSGLWPRNGSMNTGYGRDGDITLLCGADCHRQAMHDRPKYLVGSFPAYMRTIAYKTNMLETGTSQRLDSRALLAPHNIIS